MTMNFVLLWTISLGALEIELFTPIVQTKKQKEVII